MPDTVTPTALMLFAAGFGTRMGALAAHRPKPLIPVAGVALIDHALRVANAAGIAHRVANLHYRGDQLAAHLAGRDVSLSWERGMILETGGGLRAALPQLGPGPVFTLNTDAVWTGANPLTELADAWRADTMDALLLLKPSVKKERGDFRLMQDGRIVRGTGSEDHRYLGAQILRTDLLADIAEPSFSLNLVWNRMMAEGRLFGLLHTGGWCDVGTPEGITAAEAMLRDAASKDGPDVRG